jgi:hypothetical protein
MTDGPGRRFQIRYSIQRWDDGKWFYGSLFVVFMALAVFNFLEKRSVLSYIPVLVLDGIILVCLYLMRRVSYVEVASDGLIIRYVFRRLNLPYTALAKIRRQSLDVAFQPAGRRRFVNRFVRRLAKQPAVYIRLDRRQPELLADAEKRLGLRLVAGPDIVLPLSDVDAFIAEMKGRLRGS